VIYRPKGYRRNFMKLEINVKDYLSESELKEICRDAVRERVSALLCKEGDIDRFLTNASFHLVWDAVNEKCPDNMLEKITEKIPGIVEKLSSWDVFRAPDAWGREANKGWTLLQKALSDSEPLIKERVIELIRQIDMETIKYVINEHVDNVIDKLTEAR
jgi:hypothetical protein